MLKAFQFNQTQFVNAKFWIDVKVLQPLHLPVTFDELRRNEETKAIIFGQNRIKTNWVCVHTHLLIIVGAIHPCIIHRLSIAIAQQQQQIIHPLKCLMLLRFFSPFSHQLIIVYCVWVCVCFSMAINHSMCNNKHRYITNC